MSCESPRRPEFELGLALGLALALALALVACGPSLGEAPAPRPRIAGGHLVLVGGGDKPDDAMRLFVALAGGAEARLVILPLASADDRLGGAEYVERFRRLGVRDVTVLHVDDRRDAGRAAFARQIAGATGVWFAGGDQRRIAARLVDTPAHAALAAMKLAGGVIGGTSAGTACQSRWMITGDGDPHALRPGAMELAVGLGLAEGVVLDTHFGARRRHRRLAGVVLDHPEAVGLGVDEGTAVWLRPDHTFEVLGEGEVVVMEATAASRAPSASAPLTDVPGLRVITLARGARYDLTTRRSLP